MASFFNFAEFTIPIAAWRSGNVSTSKIATMFDVMNKKKEEEAE